MWGAFHLMAHEPQNVRYMSSRPILQAHNFVPSHHYASNVIRVRVATRITSQRTSPVTSFPVRFCACGSNTDWERGYLMLTRWNHALRYGARHISTAHEAHFIFRIPGCFSPDTGFFLLAGGRRWMRIFFLGHLGPSRWRDRHIARRRSWSWRCLRWRHFLRPRSFCVLWRISVHHTFFRLTRKLRSSVRMRTRACVCVCVCKLICVCCHFSSNITECILH